MEIQMNVRMILGIVTVFINIGCYENKSPQIEGVVLDVRRAQEAGSLGCRVTFQMADSAVWVFHLTERDMGLLHECAVISKGDMRYFLKEYNFPDSSVYYLWPTEENPDGIHGESIESAYPVTDST